MEAREERGQMTRKDKHGDRAGEDEPVRAANSLLTAEEVGRLLGVPRSWVYEQSRRGRIPTVALGRYRRYRRESIERWIEQLEGEG
jgi:excisionase family DNA binding protein